LFDDIRARVAQLIAPTSEKGVTIDFVSQGSVAKVQYLDGSPTDRETVDRETAFAAAVYCYAAIQYRARSVSEPPLHVVTKTPEGEKVTPHRLDELLAAPSDDYDMGETLWLTQASLDTYARTVWDQGRDNLNRTAQLMPFMGDESKVHSAGGRLFGRYELLVEGGRWENRAPEDVVHFRYLSPHSRTDAPSPVDVSLSWLNVGQATRSYVKRIMANGMFPSMVLSPHQDWHPDRDEFDMFKAELARYHTGMANAGKPFTMLGGGTATRASFSLKDLVPAEILNRVEANVAAAFGIAPVILGFLVGLENSPWSNMAEARRFTIEDTIVPLWRMVEKALTRQLLRRIDPNPNLLVRFDLSGVVALQADRSKLITDAQLATTWTLDERRLHAGQDAIGGDAGDWVEAFEPRKVPGLIDPNAKVSSVVTDTKRARSTAYSLFAVRTKRRESSWLADIAHELANESKAFARAAGSAEFAAIYAEAQKGAPEFSVAVMPREYMAALREHDAKNADGLAELLMAAVSPEVTMRAAVEPLMVTAAKEAAEDAVHQAGIAFDLVDEAAVAYARQHAGTSVAGITKTTRKRLAGVIAEAIENGTSLADLRRTIGDLTDGKGRTLFGADRAGLIAETEVTAVTNGAARKSMSDFQASDPGALVEKSWLSARDDRVRPAHVDLDDGKYIPIDDAFANGLQEPGEPRCRCTALYRVGTR
jgi:phage portal protein BeeE